MNCQDNYVFERGEKGGFLCYQAIWWNTHVLHDKSILRIVSNSSKLASCFLGDLFHYVLNLRNRRIKMGFCSRSNKCVVVPLWGVKGGCECYALCRSQTDQGSSKIHPRLLPLLVLSVSSYGCHWIS
uniref:Uncharacterized protein n=1 Tax=Arundo donax TaxID=35708 RepID=A0A0A9BYX2_ARUDO